MKNIIFLSLAAVISSASIFSKPKAAVPGNGGKLFYADFPEVINTAFFMSEILTSYFSKMTPNHLDILPEHGSYR